MGGHLRSQKKYGSIDDQKKDMDIGWATNSDLRERSLLLMLLQRAIGALEKGAARITPTTTCTIVNNRYDTRCQPGARPPTFTTA